MISLNGSFTAFGVLFASLVPPGLPGWPAPAQPIINPGELWADDRGEHIQAHGGGILKMADTYYWFGEDRSQGLSREKRYVSCYATTNLAQWTFCHRVVELADPEELGRRWVLERPKVYYNAGTGK